MHRSMQMGLLPRSCCFHRARPCSRVAMRTHKRPRVHYNLQAALEEAPTAPQIDDALLLAWLASRNKSLFAAKCLVETVLQCYQRGYLVDDLQVSLQMKVLQTPTDILGPMDQDVLLSWIMLIMSTAQQLGVPKTAASSETAAAAGAATGGGAAAAAAQGPTSQAPAAAAAAAEPDDQASAEPSAQSSGAEASAAAAAATTAAAVAAPITQRFSGQVLGLLQYVKNTLNLYQQQEYTLERLQGLQATVNRDQQGRSQFLDLMQQYTRLVLITVEVVAAQQLPTTFPLTNPHTLRSPSGYTASIWPDLQQPPAAGSSSLSSAPPSPTPAAAGSSGEAQGPPRSAARACALRLLMAWMGAVLGSSYSRQRFVACALEAYQAGYAASDLYSQVAEEEYLQTGGLIPLPGPQMVVEVNAQLFGQWLSCCYMAWAQLGLAFPRAAEQSGWAWAGGGDAVTANALAAFTAQTIRRLDLERQAAAADPELEPSTADLAAEVDPLAARIRSNPEASAGLDAATAALSQEMLQQGTYRGRPLPDLVKVPDEELASTSIGLKVWRQLLEVVQEACATATATTPTAND